MKVDYTIFIIQDESSIAGSPMKAPKGQAFNKKVSREKKKMTMDSGANEGIAVKSTHICPGKFIIHLSSLISFYCITIYVNDVLCKI